MTKQEILELLIHTETEPLFSFIAEHAANNETFCQKLKTALQPDDDEEGICNLDYYREKAEDCFDFDIDYGGRRNYHYNYYEVACKAASKLDNLLDDASFLESQGRYSDSTAMAMAVAEVFQKYYEEVDYSNGELGDTFNVAIRLLLNIIKNPAVGDPIKKDLYDWCREEVTHPFYSNYGFDEIKTLYDVCCEVLGDMNEVLADIDRQINRATNKHQKSEAVLRKIRFMQSRNIDVQEVIQTYLDLNDVRKIRFEQLINAEAYNEALHIAKQGINIAQQQDYIGLVMDWEKSIFDIYLKQKDITNLLPVAEYLLQHAGWRFHKDEFYNVLKKYTPPDQWPNTLDRLLARAETECSFDNFSAKVMQEHQLWPQLFAYCKKGSISNMEKYESKLKPHFEKELLEFYRKYVENQALKTNQFAYDEVARILKKMRNFSGGDELVNQLLEKYRTEYKRRRNMIAVLKEV